MSFRFYVASILLAQFCLAAPVFAIDIDCKISTDECPKPCSTRESLCDAAAPLILTSNNGGGSVAKGTQFTASGGSPPYTFTFDSGSLQEVDGQEGVQEIVSFSECSEPSNEIKWGTVTVTDACNNSYPLSVQLPNGSWVYETTRGTCRIYCSDYGMPDFVTFYGSGKKFLAYMYWSTVAPNGTCTTGEPVSGTSGGFTGQDGNTYLSLPALSEPYPEVRPYSGVCGTNRYYSWSTCGVCGYLSSYPDARLCYTAQCVSEYKLVCN